MRDGGSVHVVTASSLVKLYGQITVRVVPLPLTPFLQPVLNLGKLQAISTHRLRCRGVYMRPIGIP